MNFFAFSALINGIAATLFGIFGYLKNRRSSLHKIFGLMNFSVAFWSYSYFLWQMAQNKNEALFWARTLAFGATLIPIFYLHWILIILGLTQQKKRILIFGYLLTFIFLILSLTPFYVLTVSPQLSFPYWPKGGILYLFYIFFVYLGLSGYGVYQLFKNYRRSSREKKAQIKYLIAGSLVGFGAGAFNFPLWYSIPIPPYSNPLVTLYTIIFGYAMFKHHLMNIKVVFTEFLVAIIGLILLVQAALAKNLWDIVFRVGILLLFSYFGYLLIRSVLQEIRRREELERLTEELKIANLQLKRFDQAKSDFVDIASHQLRTPTTGFKGYMSMLLEGDFGPLTKEQERVVKMCYENTERMSRLIDTFLDVTRIEAGRLELNKQKVQLEDLIEEAFKILKFTAETKKLYLKFEKPKEKLPKLFVDPERIRDVLFNLIDNALKYTSKGGVTVSCEKSNYEIITHVRDTGIGIPKEEQKIIFGKFIRGDRAVINPNGSGLGLFIIKKIIEAHQGKVWVESEGRNKGSTFSFSLPLK